MLKYLAPALLALAVLTAPAAAAQSPQEDDPGWSCVTAGNHVCGPDSDDAGHAPGCYSDTGVLVAKWPCFVRIDAVTGDADVYTPDAR